MKNESLLVISCGKAKVIYFYRRILTNVSVSCLNSYTAEYSTVLNIKKSETPVIKMTYLLQNILYLSDISTCYYLMLQNLQKIHSW